MSSHTNLPTSSPFGSADSKEDDLARFAGLIKILNPKLFPAYGTFVRFHMMEYKLNKDITCEVRLPPISGAFNLIYRLEFSDDISWAVRIPLSNKYGAYEQSQERRIQSEVRVMQFLRRRTSIPIPEVFAFDLYSANPIGVPFILMEFISGLPVHEVWFKDDEETPLEERRLRILDGLAANMSELSKFSFTNIATLDNPEALIEIPRPLKAFNQQAQCDAIKNGIDPELEYVEIGPFTSSQNYFKALVALRSVPISTDHEAKIGIYRLLLIMIECLPPSFETASDSRETFVLAHPDFNVQNILVKEDGTITGIIDWDNVHTVPRCVGYSQYPSWITRDWDPMMYGYGNPNSRPENSPEELEHYRQYYSAAMRSLRPEGCLDYTTKSHLHEAVSIAAYNPICTSEIVTKIFEYVFPEELEDEEYPLEYFDTLYALANDDLDVDTKNRMYESFRNAFSVTNIE